MTGMDGGHVASADGVPLGKRVLVVDDDHEFAYAVSLYFQMKGIDVITAGDGIAAVEATESMSPDAIILDLMLPELDGLGFCTFLRQGLADCDTPVIVLTGVSDPGWRQDMFSAGANDYLTKPHDFAKLFSLVRGYLSDD